jgi:hypothetical protein
MPWLHRIFDAYEDHRKERAREAALREEIEAQGLEAMKVFEHAIADDDGMENFDERDEDGAHDRKKHRKDKKKHKHKHKEKRRDWR